MNAYEKHSLSASPLPVSTSLVSRSAVTPTPIPSRTPTPTFRTPTPILPRIPTPTPRALTPIPPRIPTPAPRAPEEPAAVVAPVDTSPSPVTASSASSPPVSSPENKKEKLKEFLAFDVLPTTLKLNLLTLIKLAIPEVTELKELMQVSEKLHALEVKNLLRKERDRARLFSHGNTRSWQDALLCLKDKALLLAKADPEASGKNKETYEKILDEQRGRVHSVGRTDSRVKFDNLFRVSRR